MNKTVTPEDVLKQMKDIFDYCTNSLTKIQLDHFRLNFTTPKGTLGKWEWVCVTSPKDPASQSIEELNAASNKTWTFTVTLYEEKIESTLNGFKMEYSLEQFSRSFDFFRENVKIWMNLTKAFNA
mgnify:CR=1 FL=1